MKELLKMGAAAAQRMGIIVEDIMTRELVCIGAEDTLQQALELMNRDRVRRLVIADDEDPFLGVISRADLIKLYSTH